MLSVSQAQDVILQAARPLSARTLPLGPTALGLILAEDVSSDIDSPPFDKALMDGYAVRSADLPEGRGELSVIEEVTAGRMPTRRVEIGQATRIMTGAPLPDGADAVIQVERTTLLDGERVRIEDRPPRVGTNILRLGSEMRRGQVVLSAGCVLRPQELGVLASVGRTEASLIPPVRVAIVSTGDEIVESSQIPGPGQIRNSNGHLLVAQVHRAGALAAAMCIARDNEDHLGAAIRQGLTADVLLLSGGVSAGKLDLVPKVLQDCGVEAKFHKVEMKPGRPLYFGVRPRDADGPTLVFGLPGNPVSTFVCFELFVRPALRALGGNKVPLPRIVQAELTQDFPYRTERVTYHPAQLETDERGWRVRLVPWFGSPDLLGLMRANALAVLPVGDHHHRAGRCLPVLCLE